MAVAVTIVAAMIEIITSYPHREPPSRRVAKDGRMKEKCGPSTVGRIGRGKRSRGIDNDINDTITGVSSCTNTIHASIHYGTIISAASWKRFCDAIVKPVSEPKCEIVKLKRKNLLF